MKVLIENWDGTCAECSGQIVKIHEVYFCCEECADKYRIWVRFKYGEAAAMKEQEQP